MKPRGMIFARAVNQKGLGGNGEMNWLVEAICNELDVWGYRGQQIIMKSDQEPSIEALRKAVSELRGGMTTWENSPVGESASNGKVEDAGRRVREYLITLKDQLEMKIGGTIATDADILQWMVRWSAIAISKCKVGLDGKTAYEKLKGRKCRQEILPFGENVWYKELGKQCQNENRQG